MDTDNTQEPAEPSPASAGSHPVAWRVYADDGSEIVHLFYEQARAAADEWNWSVEPLYRQPTLTDEERFGRATVSRCEICNGVGYGRAKCYACGGGAK